MKRIISLTLCSATLSLLLCACQNTTHESAITSHSSDSTSSTSSSVASEISSEVEPEAVLDDRGIPGMTATAFLLVTEKNFDVPYSVKPSDNPEYSAYTCTSIGGSGGVWYDYSISLDNDYEIIGGSFGVVGSDVTDTELFHAAELYYYALALSVLDAQEQETLSSWFGESLPNATNGKSSIVVGGAAFDLYCTGSMYFVDISKA